MFALTDTILAVASPPGWSSRGIIRMSGDDVLALLHPHLAPHAGPDDRREAGPGPVVNGCVMRRARLRLRSLDLPSLTMHWRAPRSYTGQDSAELQLPGNPHLLQRVADALIGSARDRGQDARRAEPGEFTARAYLNGRMSLTQAEGVAASIAAQSDAELRAAHLLTAGSLGSLARSLADDLAGALALVEAGIDFTDQEDVVPIGPAALHARIVALHERIASHLHRAIGSESLGALPWVVIAGRPNAGKSTLFNALLGRARAVVTDVAGTTRDVLAEPMTIPGSDGPAEVMLVDMAGLDDESSMMNRQMQSAARGAVDRADLILHCMPPDAYAGAPPAISPDRPAIIVRTKADLCSHEGLPGDPTVTVSAVTGIGLDELRRAVAERVADRAVSLSADALALSPRHDAALRSAQGHLAAAVSLIEPAKGQRALADVELIAAWLRAALNDLSELAGEITPDDVLGRVFASFCVGK